TAVYFVVSLATPAPTADKVEGLCWTRPLDALRGKMEGITDPRLMAATLVIIMVILYAWLH
ncbi:MAG: sodium:glucose symporter, partial [Planctomycetes bacterium]|nr:sodium:glucose symporter [Planctomycetota bacterium]